MSTMAWSTQRKFQSWTAFFGGIIFGCEVYVGKIHPPTCSAKLRHYFGKLTTGTVTQDNNLTLVKEVEIALIGTQTLWLIAEFLQF